jgi:hypothetical protein
MSFLTDFCRCEATHEIAREPWRIFTDDGWKTVATDGVALVIAPDDGKSATLPDKHAEMVDMYVTRERGPIAITLDRAKFSEWLGPCERVMVACDNHCWKSKGKKTYGFKCPNRIGRAHYSTHDPDACDCKHDPECYECNRGWRTCRECNGTGKVEDKWASVVAVDGVYLQGPYLRRIIDLPWYSQAVVVRAYLGTTKDPTLWEVDACKTWLMPVDRKNRAVPEMPKECAVEVKVGL